MTEHCECLEVTFQEGPFDVPMDVLFEEEVLQCDLEEEVFLLYMSEQAFGYAEEAEQITVIEEHETIQVTLADEDAFQVTFDEVFVQSTIGEDDVPYDILTDHVIVDAATNEFYIGKAAPGADTADAVWQVRRRRVTETGDEVDVDEKYADGDGTFGKVWDDRLSFTY